MTDDHTHESGAEAFRRDELPARRQDRGDAGAAIAPVTPAPGESAPALEQPQKLDTGIISSRVAERFQRPEMTADRERPAPGNTRDGGEK